MVYQEWLIQFLCLSGVALLVIAFWFSYRVWKARVSHRSYDREKFECPKLDLPKR